MNNESNRPASEQPVEAIGAGRESEAATVLQRIILNSGGFLLEPDDAKKCVEALRAALSPASPARTPMGGGVEALREADVARAVMDAVPTIKGGWTSAYKIAEKISALAASSPPPAQGGAKE